MPSLKYHLRFPEEKVPSPIVYEIGKEYPVITNIRGANESAGSMDFVSDDEIVEGIKTLAQTEGIFAETAGGVTIGVLKKLVKNGLIKKGDVTVAYVTGNGLKTQEAIADFVGRPVRTLPKLQSFEEGVPHAN